MYKYPLHGCIIFLKTVYFYLVYMSDLAAWMYVEHILGIWRGRRGCRSLEVELQVVMNCHVGAGNGFPVLFLQGWSVFLTAKPSLWTQLASF